jgi:hypothetical protein
MAWTETSACSEWNKFYSLVSTRIFACAKMMGRQGNAVRPNNVIAA